MEQKFRDVNRVMNRLICVEKMKRVRTDIKTDVINKMNKYLPYNPFWE
jgi:hypothetical protein